MNQGTGLRRPIAERLSFNGYFNSPFTTLIGNTSRALLSRSFMPNAKEPLSFVQPAPTLRPPIVTRPIITPSVNVSDSCGEAKGEEICNLPASQICALSRGLPEQSYLSASQIPLSAPQSTVQESVKSLLTGAKSEEPSANVSTRKVMKKEKNRISAQKCRLRKKEYVRSLEARIEVLTEELRKCKEELQVLKTSKELNSCIQSAINEYRQKRTASIKQLGSMVEKDEADEELYEAFSGMNVNLGNRYRSSAAKKESCSSKSSIH
eukprot:TRINITY_DN9669_c0_g1_i15.p1 TRINITY_DN9669_c0_g1~~TRINITY_DN9669_c0_g1_i15.p1  ORF type:complete len:265 (-),score=47.17 TRINITY_DN9669_c0_g1_i15:600-1394(-)